MKIWLVWLCLSLAMVVVEALTVSFFALTVAIAALVTMLVSFMTSVIWVQVTVFLLCTLVFFVTLRPAIRKLFPVKEEVRTAVNRLEGREAVVIAEINNVMGNGQIKVDGEVWSARSISGEVLPVGTRVTISTIDGVKAVIDKIAE